MANQTRRWELLDNGENIDVVKVLLKNRGLKSEKDKNEFLNPPTPYKKSLSGLSIKETEIKKAVDRIKKAERNKEHILIYGDYDADGICATAIAWEALHNLGCDVLPFIPDRFSDGYGIKADTVKNLIAKDDKVKLILTVDNGIVGYDGIETAKKLGVDVIVIDHHTKGKKKNLAFSVIHSTEVCGAALSWFFAKELGLETGLELAAIGTIADQMPLVGVNRSVAKFGLNELNKTKRPGLKALFENSKIKEVGTYEVNYIIAPRINAMGRLAQGLDSLRLLCTKSHEKAKELAKLLDKTNYERQVIVEKVVERVLKDSKNNKNKLLVIAHEEFHEGVIGLAAGKLVEEFYRPAIVLSKKEKISKASARSISGFNIIEAIKATNLISEGGGHPMAAGFSIKTSDIELFTKEINKVADKLLTEELLQKKLKIDLELKFNQIDQELLNNLKLFTPTGIGNPEPTFISKNIETLDAKVVGRDGKHLKIKLRQGEHIFDSIYFGGGEIYSDLTPDSKTDIVYALEENIWNGRASIQLKMKDIRLLN